MNPSDDPAAHTGNTSTTNDPQAAAAATTNNNNDNEADPSSNEFQNLFHENNDTSMQLDPRGEGIHWNGDSIPANEVGVFNSNYEVVDLGEEQYGVPPLPPPVDNEAEEVVVIPNNVEQQGEPQREEVVVVEGEIIGPQLQQQQQAVEEEEEGVPVETVQLWEEVAFGLEKNQTGKFYLFLTFILSELIMRGRGGLVVPLHFNRNQLPYPLMPFFNSIFLTISDPPFTS